MAAQYFCHERPARSPVGNEPLDTLEIMLQRLEINTKPVHYRLSGNVMRISRYFVVKPILS